MEILKGLLVVVEALIGLLVIGLVLLQKARDQGLGLAFGSGVGESIFGSRAGNVLTKGTVWLGSAFMINTVLLAVLFAGKERSLMEKAEGARGSAPAATAPQTPGPQPGAPAAGPAAAPVAGSATVPVTIPSAPASQTIPLHTPPPPGPTPAAVVPAPAPAPAPAGAPAAKP